MFAWFFFFFFNNPKLSLSSQWWQQEIQIHSPAIDTLQWTSLGIDKAAVKAAHGGERRDMATRWFSDTPT